MDRSIYIGFDPRESTAYAVAHRTTLKHLSQPIPVHGLILADLIDRGLYTRPMERRDTPNGPVLWDTLSDAPCSTEHANARFLTPHLANTGWALFMDGDVLIRSDLAQVFEGLNPIHAVYCVKHDYQPQPGVKMDGQLQTSYSRKLWSSFVIFNCDHPSNKKLTLEVINSVPGRELHRFCWLKNDEIGELPKPWNFLVGHDDPKVAHFTLGTPDMPGYENSFLADEWRREAAAVTEFVKAG